MTRKLFSSADGPALTAEYAAGATAAEIAQKRGCSTSAVQRELTRLGVPRRPPVRRPNWTGTDAQKDEAVRLYRSGLPVRRLAKHFSCAEKPIANLLRERGCDVRRGRDRLTPEAKAALLSRSVQPGVTVRALAAEFGMSSGSVSALLRRAGQPPRNNRWTPEMQARVVQQYESGLSQQQIADQLGIRQPTVSIRLRAAGVLPRHPAATGPDHGSWRGGRVKSGGYCNACGSHDVGLTEIAKE